MNNHHFLTRAIVILVFVVCWMPDRMSAQAQVSPTRVMLTMRDRSQQVDVFNPTSDPIELTVDLDYRLIRSDSSGKTSLSSVVSAEEHLNSCKEWLKVFPRRFTLQPGTSRSLRILVVPVDDIRDGEYWGRLIIGSLRMSHRMDVVDTSANGIRTDLAMRIELDIPIIFRKGNVETGIAFQGISAMAGTNETILLVDLDRLGNSAYRGTLFASLTAADGSSIKHVERQFTVEFSLRTSLRLPSLTPGSYSLALEARSIKKGGANDAVIQAPPVQKMYDLLVNSTTIHVKPRE